MKWSQLIGWLKTIGKASLLGFLEEVPDEKSKWYPEWARMHPQLTFRKWDSIGFLPRGHEGISTETLPILHSPQNRQLAFRGGVSLARRETIANRAPLADKVPASARRGAVDFSRFDPSARRLQMLDKREFTFQTVRRNITKIVAKTDPQMQIRLRGVFGEIENTGFETSIERTPRRVVIGTRARGAEVGELQISRSVQGFKVGWRNRDIDCALIPGSADQRRK